MSDPMLRTMEDQWIKSSFIRRVFCSCILGLLQLWQGLKRDEARQDAVSVETILSKTSPIQDL